MSSLDVERRLTQVLHRHAEDAMSQTDTQQELREFLSRGDPEPSRALGRNRFTAAVAAGVAATAAAAAVFWTADLAAERADPAPVVEPAPDPAQVADEYTAAYAAYDTAKVLSMADPDADLGGLRLSQERDEAFGFRLFMEPCRAGSVLGYGTQVACPFSLHVMHSEEVGSGPFENATFNVMVTEDGKVLDSNPDWNFELNGMTEHWEKVTDWVWAQHPDQQEFLALDEPEVPAAEWDRWLELWERYLQEYADAHS
ncbi:MAG: hypothetical protein ACLGH4_07400 [Actinomycetes bacterium]